MRSENRDDLDRVLEEGLASYSSRDPRPGIESRVMLRLDAGVETYNVRYFWWAFAIAGTVALFLLIAPLWTERTSVPSSSRTEEPTQVRTPDLAGTPTEEASKELGRVIAKKRPQPDVPTIRASLPQREQFPTPAPLTSEERALLAWIGAAPEQAREVFSAMQRRSQGPLPIPEIDVPPLRSEGLFERSNDAEDNNGLFDAFGDNGNERDLLLPDSGEAIGGR